MLPPVFNAWRRRRQVIDRRRADETMRRVFQKGYDARVQGRPCKPPDGYEVRVGFDMKGEWIAGWAKAEREIDSGDE